MIPPGITIRVAVESAPIVFCDAMSDAEENRFAHWLTVQHPEFGELVARALELAEERAA